MEQDKSSTKENKKEKFDTKKPKRDLDRIIKEITKIHRAIAAEGLMNESAYLKKAIKELQRAGRSL